MNDPFAMRPFFGYNFGHYLSHWLSLGKRPGAHLPKIFHVNWFRKDSEGRFLWPGYGENSRVLDWILRRVDGQDVAQESPIGYIPKSDSMNLTGLSKSVDFRELFNLNGDFWRQEAREIRNYLESQVGNDLPAAILKELEILEKNVATL